MNLLNIFTNFWPAAVPWDWILQPYIFLYLGPESILPLASIVAAIVGVLLIFWRYIVGFVRKGINLIRGKPNEEPGAEVGEESDIQDVDDWLSDSSDEN